MRFLNAVFWEFVQNLPVIVLFVAAVWLWSRKRKKQSIACTLVGAIAGSLIIRFTEPLKSGYHEPWSITVTNIVVIGLLQLLFTAYLGTETSWSNWKIDMLLGALAGISLAAAQGLASQGSPLTGIILHSVALAVAGSLVLTGIRKTKEHPLVSALGGALLLVVVMTLLIGAIDYGYFLFG